MEALVFKNKLRYDYLVEKQCGSISLKEVKASWERQKKKALKTRKVRVTTNTLQNIDEIIIEQNPQVFTECEQFQQNKNLPSGHLFILADHL